MFTPKSICHISRFLVLLIAAACCTSCAPLLFTPAVDTTETVQLEISTPFTVKKNEPIIRTMMCEDYLSIEDDHLAGLDVYLYGIASDGEVLEPQKLNLISEDGNFTGNTQINLGKKKWVLTAAAITEGTIPPSADTVFSTAILADQVQVDLSRWVRTIHFVLNSDRLTTPTDISFGLTLDGFSAEGVTVTAGLYQVGSDIPEGTLVTLFEDANTDTFIKTGVIPGYYCFRVIFNLDAVNKTEYQDIILIQPGTNGMYHTVTIPNILGPEYAVASGTGD